MLMRSSVMALLKVLISAAWADSRLSQSEVNYIKSLARKFNLSDSEWHELEPYLEDPVPEQEREALVHDLMAHIATPFERETVIRYLEEIIASDSEVTSEEHQLLERYTAILREASTLDLLIGRVKGLFGKRDPVAAIDIDEFVRNKVFFKLRRRIGTGQIPPETYRLALVGGLMGIVAHADGEIHEKESQEIRRQLETRGKFDPESLDVLMSVIEEESVRGLDRSRLISEYARNAALQERVGLLDLLFAVAAADGKLTHAELEELRGISSALQLSHKQYIAAKLRYRQ